MPAQQALEIAIYVVVAAVSFYVFLILPQQISRRRRQKLLNALSVGDEVVTVGGIIGRVRRIEGGEATLDLGRDVQVRVVLSGISHRRQGSKVVELDKAPEKAPPKSRGRPRRR